MKNRHYKIVFQPLQPELFGNRRRFGIGTRSVSKYIGESNAESVRKRVEKHELTTATGVIEINLRKWGKISVYAL